MQDVLQRFDSVEKAVDWALRRPVRRPRRRCCSPTPAASVGAVEIDGRTRRVLGAGEPARVGLGPAAAVAALEKALAEARALDADALARLLAEPAAAPLVAVADPAGRRLGIAHAGAPLEWHPVEPRSAPLTTRDGPACHPPAARDSPAPGSLPIDW